MWDQSIFDTLKQTRAQIRSGGGARQMEKQHAHGKLSARERLDLLFDRGTFHELSEMVESRSSDFGMDQKKIPGDGVVGGYGEVDGRLVFAISQDFTVCGGAGGEEYALKICKVLEMAIKARAPFVNLNDSGGARIEEGICSLSAYSRLFYLNTVASGLIPQIAVIMGPCAGGASYSPALCDFIFMTKSTSQMYITGPQVIKTVTGQDVSGEALGGWSVHMKQSGNVHFACEDDESCLRELKHLLSYLPSNNQQQPPRKADSIPVDRCRELCDFVPQNKRQPYDVRGVIERFVDLGSFFEVQDQYAENMVVGFARLDGESIGIIANQPKKLGGSIDCNAADKTSRFIRFCDCFNIPLVSLVDVPAFLPGVEQEYNGIIRHGAKLLYAFSEASVPKICLIMRKAYGGAFCAMNSKSMSADVVFAWPIAEVAVMGDDGAVNIIFRKQIAAAADPEQEHKRLVDDYTDKFMNPYFAAKRGFVDQVIYPHETREKISAALKMLCGKKDDRPWKKHGNMPL